ncbi:hypothetical protein N9N03_02445 [Chlamydiia bacterium]|nr:hypothetical protein [Chlamydiia bacterium]
MNQRNHNPLRIALTLMLMLTLSFSTTAHTVETYATDEIRVLLSTNIESVDLNINSGYTIHDPQTGKSVSSSFFAKHNKVFPKHTGLSWGEEFPGIYQLHIVPSSNDAMSINGEKYFGEIIIYQDQNKIHIVNKLKIENLVRSVLSDVINEKVSQDLIAALAVLVRTKAYQSIINDNPYWDISQDELSYKGQFSLLPNINIERSVVLTDGIVLESQDKEQCVEPLWHEHSAGQSIGLDLLSRHVNTPSNTTVNYDLSAVDRVNTKWTTTMSLYDLSKALNLPGNVSIELTEDAATKRVVGVSLSNGHERKDLDYFEFRNLVGAHTLKSSLFSVTTNGEKLTFDGYGRGHGVGLCIYAAKKMAEKNFNSVDILKKGFPFAELKRVNVIANG